MSGGRKSKPFCVRVFLKSDPDRNHALAWSADAAESSEKCWIARSSVYIKFGKANSTILRDRKGEENAKSASQEVTHTRDNCTVCFHISIICMKVVALR